MADVICLSQANTTPAFILFLLWYCLFNDRFIGSQEIPVMSDLIASIALSKRSHKYWKPLIELWCLSWLPVWSMLYQTVTWTGGVGWLVESLMDSVHTSQCTHTRKNNFVSCITVFVKNHGWMVGIFVNWMMLNIYLRIIFWKIVIGKKEEERKWDFFCFQKSCRNVLLIR